MIKADLAKATDGELLAQASLYGKVTIAHDRLKGELTPSNKAIFGVFMEIRDKSLDRHIRVGGFEYRKTIIKLINEAVELCGWRCEVRN